MIEVLNQNPDSESIQRIGYNSEGYSISGVLDRQHNIVWVDDIDFSKLDTNSTDNPTLVMHSFASESAQAGANELRFVCPEMKDLQLLSRAFTHDKIRFYENITEGDTQKQIKHTEMTLHQALRSLQDIELIPTNELFPTSWFEVGVDVISYK